MPAETDDSESGGEAVADGKPTTPLGPGSWDGEHDTVDIRATDKAELAITWTAASSLDDWEGTGTWSDGKLAVKSGGGRFFGHVLTGEC